MATYFGRSLFRIRLCLYENNFKVKCFSKNIFYPTCGRERIFSISNWFTEALLTTKFLFPVLHIKRNCASEDLDMDFVKDKEMFLKMNLDEKRNHYQCRENFVSLNSIPTWERYFREMKTSRPNVVSEYTKSKQLNDKVSLFVGDITALEIDCIVNAANKTLKGGGGVDGAIHRAAGPKLVAECSTLGGCDTGDAKITGGYKLPAKYVIHTVGPFGEKPDLLASCYRTSLETAKQAGSRSIAFPCISTGVYRYPNENAAVVALKTVREWLEANERNMDRIIFCLFLPIDVELYRNLMHKYFPV